MDKGTDPAFRRSELSAARTESFPAVHEERRKRVARYHKDGALHQHVTEQHQVLHNVIAVGTKRPGHCSEREFLLAKVLAADDCIQHLVLDLNDVRGKSADTGMW